MNRFNELLTTGRTQVDPEDSYSDFTPPLTDEQASADIEECEDTSASSSRARACGRLASSAARRLVRAPALRSARCDQMIPAATGRNYPHHLWAVLPLRKKRRRDSGKKPLSLHLIVLQLNLCVLYILL